VRPAIELARPPPPFTVTFTEVIPVGTAKLPVEEKVSLPCSTVRVELPLTPLSVAVIDAEPWNNPVASPSAFLLLLMVAMDVLEEDHFALVRTADDPSL
jgi:hypothetical protein